MYLFWVPASLPGFLDPHVIISVIPRKWREEITVEFHVAWICKAKFELSWVNVFCIVYTLVFLRRVILLCRPILEAMCIVVFQSSLSEYERFLPSWNYCRVWSSCQPSLIPFFFFCILRYPPGGYWSHSLAYPWSFVHRFLLSFTKCVSLETASTFLLILPWNNAIWGDQWRLGFLPTPLEQIWISLL